jgi:hypothetical protein
MMGRPEPEEAESYYWRYIDQVQGEDIVSSLATQLDETPSFFSRISEEKSLHRYAPGKWSIRQVLNHVSDAERVFLFRAFWFARGFTSPLPSYDEATGAAGAQADAVPWAKHIEEFRSVRAATLTFVRGLAEDAWVRRGVASGCAFSVRALAYIMAGHLAHHRAILEERYL